MLSQIELAYSAPTINVMWRIAHALKVPFGSLIDVESVAGVRVLRAAESKVLASHHGRFQSRALFPFDAPRRTELYQLTIKPRGVESAGTRRSGARPALGRHSWIKSPMIHELSAEYVPTASSVAKRRDALRSGAASRAPAGRSVRGAGRPVIVQRMMLRNGSSS